MGIFQKRSISKTEYVRFIEENKRLFYRIAYSYLNHEQDALEAIDESVYQAYVKLHTLKDESMLKPWFIRILINRSLDMLRRRKFTVLVEELPDTLSSEEDVSLLIKLTVEELPDELRQIVLLRYFHDLTIKDTAQMLHIPEGTVATRTRQALAILKDSLEKGAYDELSS